MSRPDLQTLCDSLELKLPDLLAQHRRSGEFWAAFAENAQEIGRQAFDEDEEAYVAARVDAMLAANSVQPA